VIFQNYQKKRSSIESTKRCMFNSSDFSQLSKEEIEHRINEEVYGLSFNNFKFTGLFISTSILLGLRLPKSQRFLPLLVLGATGSLLDLHFAEERVKPLKQALKNVESHQSTREKVEL